MRVDRRRTNMVLRGLAVATTAYLAHMPAAAADFQPGERITISAHAGVPVPGDFDGDGHVDVLFYNPGSRPDPFLKGGPGGFEVFPNRYVVSGTGYTPVSGDFDGSGTNDILWYRPGTGTDFYWYFASDGTYTSAATRIDGVYTVVVGDFDGNTVDDLFWYAPGTKTDFVWYSNPDGSHRSVARSVKGTYIPVAGDFDGNTVDDILWYLPGTGADFQWNFRPDRTYASVPRTINGIYKPFAGDFDANTVDDIFWFAPGPAVDHVWSHPPGGASYTSRRASQGGSFTGIAGNYDTDPAEEIFWAGTGTSELWADPPGEYWWSDTYLDNLTPTPEGPRTGYDRDLFDHWILRFGGACDTREVVLYRESRTAARVDIDDCSIDQGRWLSYFDNTTVTLASSLHVDHLVPLAEAWDSGAAAWTADTRRSFANDIGVDYALVAVTAAANTSKSDSDPAEWQPPTASARCRYASEWVAVKDRWNLTADPAELDALDQMLHTCPSDTPLLPPDPRIPPAYYDPTPPPPPPPTCSTNGNAYTPANGGCIDRYDANRNGDINCAELPAAAKPVRVKNPAVDPYNLDADNDGWGCDA